MMWYNATGRIFEKDNEIVDANVDILNTAKFLLSMSEVIFLSALIP